MTPKSIMEVLRDEFPEYYQGEKNVLPSETVPNQAITAKEAWQRSLRNLPVPAAYSSPEQMPFDGNQVHDPKTGFYKGEDFDFENMQSPIFSDEMDVADFNATLLDKVKRGMKVQTPTPSDPAPQLSPEPQAPKEPEPKS